MNAASLWAKQVGRMAGLDLPFSPLEHHYLLTETIPEIAASKAELPMVVGLEGFTYMGQDQKRHPGRRLRDPSSALVDGRRAVGLWGRAPAGGRRPHRRIKPSPYDPLGKAMRA